MAWPPDHLQHSFDDVLADDAARARATDPDTSHEAAASVTNVTALQQLILDRLLWPRTDEELVRQVQQSGFKATPQSVRSRRAELVKRGLVEASGDYGETVTGRRARKWQTVLHTDGTPATS